RISGASGSLMTIMKLFPSGQVLAAPLQYFTRSAKGTSVSLLPAATTTAMFLIAGTAGRQVSTSNHSAKAPRSSFTKKEDFIPPDLSDWDRESIGWSLPQRQVSNERKRKL